MKELAKTIILIIFVVPILCQTAGRDCKTPLNDIGSCVSLKNCPEIPNIFRRVGTAQGKEYSKILQQICNNRVTADNYPVVCCTKPMYQDNPFFFATPVAPTAAPTTTTTATTTTTTTKQPLFIQTTEAVKLPLEEDRSLTQLPAGNCRGPALEEGVCKPLRLCSSFLDRLRNNPEDENFKSYLRSSNKNCAAAATNVCCPTDATVIPILTDTNTITITNDIPRHFLTEEEGCGYAIQSQLKIVGGEESQIGAWPWIVLIGYDKYSLKPFSCGGTLITARHVITAAHCFNSRLSFVRLGEYDVTIDTETPHVDINVINKVSHPNFGADYRHDIGLLLLERNVQFTDTIKPICMPTSKELRDKNYVRSNPFIAGWGRVAYEGVPSNILKQAQIPILNNSVCERVYKNFRTAVKIDDTVICAGVLSGGIDTCRGDSGGPLMVPEPYKGYTRYYLLGVVSYGIRCAEQGIPGVYTSARYFIDWIETTMANMQS